MIIPGAEGATAASDVPWVFTLAFAVPLLFAVVWFVLNISRPKPLPREDDDDDDQSPRGA